MAPLGLISAPIGRFIDRLTDRLTSYRLVLYILIAYLTWAVIGGLFGKVGYTAASILSSAGLLVIVCFGVNRLLARFLDIVPNQESDLISALILALILPPASTSHDYVLIALAGAAAMASKYILVWKRSHIFNPAAFGAVVAGVVFSYYPSWWIGTKFTTPLIVLGAILILRKVKRFQLALVFMAVYVLALIWTSPSGTTTDAIRHLLLISLTSTAVFFFASVMLDEPLTSPAALDPTLVYGLIVGVCYSFNRLHISPEESLLIGNAFTFIFARNRRYKLQLINKVKDAEGIYSYVFKRPTDFKFKAGQYMEWTLNRQKFDSRGNRRYLTISSAPTENLLAITVKVPPAASAFKQRLDGLQPGETIFASYLSGSFNLPNNNQKLAFLAGGVGITPFRSMVKGLVDAGAHRDVELVYSVSSKEEVAFADLFTQAQANGIKPHYIVGRVTSAHLQALSDYKNRHFFVSGPYNFVEAMEKALLEMGLSPAQITTDYFPGYSG